MVVYEDKFGPEGMIAEKLNGGGPDLGIGSRVRRALGGVDDKGKLKEPKPMALAKIELREYAVDGGELVVAGADHNVSYEEFVEIIEVFDEFANKSEMSDLDIENESVVKVLVETGVVEVVRSLEQGLTDEAVFVHGEQVLIAYKALERGFEVDTWDLDPREMIEYSIQEYGREETLLWFVAQTMTFVGESQNVYGDLLGLADNKLNMSREDLVGLFGEVIESEKLVVGCVNKVLGYGWQALGVSEEQVKKLTRLAVPRKEGEYEDINEREMKVARISGELGRKRDEMALEKIIRKIGRGEKVFAVCGTYHVDEWDRLLREQVEK